MSNDKLNKIAQTVLEQAYLLNELTQETTSCAGKHTLEALTTQALLLGFALRGATGAERLGLREARSTR